MGQGTYRVLVLDLSRGAEGEWVCVADGFLDRDNAVEYAREHCRVSEWEIEWVHPAESPQ